MSSYIKVDYEEGVFEVEYQYHGSWPGARERSTGLQLEPDEDESIEILGVTAENGKDVTPDEDQQVCFEEACWCHARRYEDDGC